ncbi:MAG: hypothetical protein AABX38_02920 [Candidatus Micrarchaeota archaeon]|mgnify:CR=1 FL=1
MDKSNFSAPTTEAFDAIKKLFYSNPDEQLARAKDIVQDYQGKIRAEKEGYRSTLARCYVAPLGESKDLTKEVRSLFAKLYVDIVIEERDEYEMYMIKNHRRYSDEVLSYLETQSNFEWKEKCWEKQIKDMVRREDYYSLLLEAQTERRVIQFYEVGKYYMESGPNPIERRIMFGLAYATICRKRTRQSGGWSTYDESKLASALKEHYSSEMLCHKLPAEVIRSFEEALESMGKSDLIAKARTPRQKAPVMIGSNWGDTLKTEPDKKTDYRRLAWKMGAKIRLAAKSVERVYANRIF